MENFTPVSALIGGTLIGLAAVVLMLANGRIAGISGIFGGALFDAYGRLWKLAFVAGLIIAPPLVWLVKGDAPAFELDAGLLTIALAGLLVGAGTRLGSGCTSGHGVCGISRLSPRSIVATLVFMALGMAATIFLRPLMGGL